MAASTGVSARRNGRRAGFGNVRPIASEHSEQLERQHDGCRDHDPFERYVIAPVFWKGRIGTAHRAISHVVPSLESLMTTPIAASWSRIRSDSLKSLRARAASRAAIEAFTSSLLTATVSG